MSTLTPEVKAKIDAMSYEALLREVRFEPVGSPLFQGEVGDYKLTRIAELRSQPGGQERHVGASTRIGSAPSKMGESSVMGEEATYCKECGNEVDIGMCHCGVDYNDHHAEALGHNFVPMGCTCGYPQPTVTFPVAVGHSHVGPSSVAHYLTCPAFEPPPQPVDEEDDDPAVRGKMLHNAMEKGDWSDLDPHEQDLCDYALEQQLLLADGFRDFETEVTMYIVPGVTGTADLIASRHRQTPSLGLVLDYKFGRIPVTPASDNWQGRSYGLGLVRRFKHLQSVKVGFIQPLLRYVTWHIYSRAELEAYAPVIERAAAMAENHQKGITNGAAIPTHTACRYCRKALTCAARNKWLGQTNKELASYSEQGKLSAPAGWTHDPHTWDTPDKVDFGIKFLDTVGRWAPAAKAVIIDRLQDSPELSAEFKVVSASGQKRVSASASDEEVATSLGVDEAEIAPIRGRVSIAGIRGLLRRKGLKREEIDARLEEMEEKGLLTTGAASPRIVEQKHVSTPISLPEDRDLS